MLTHLSQKDRTSQVRTLPLERFCPVASGIEEKDRPGPGHTRLTDLAKQGFSGMELRIVAGRERNSPMPEVYVNLSCADVERELLENAGFINDTPDP